MHFILVFVVLFLDHKLPWMTLNRHGNVCLFQQLLEAIQVLRFHLMEIEKVLIMP